MTTTTTSNPPPLPTPPFYSIPNINNLRDAALFPLTTTTTTTTSGNSIIRPGVLFRSAEVSKLSLSGWSTLHNDLGISHVFDLRSKPEVEKGWEGHLGKNEAGEGGDVSRKPSWMQDMEAAGVKRVFVPVFEEADYSPERLAERYVKYMDEDVAGFVAAYEDILGSAGPAFGRILRYLAGLSPPSSPPPSLPPSGSKEQEGYGKEKEKEAALIHCTAGKDRTGIFFGLLFDFLAVPRSQIAAEYNLTELGLASVREDVVARLVQAPAFRNYMLGRMNRSTNSTTSDTTTTATTSSTIDTEDIANSLRAGQQQQQGDGSQSAAEAVEIPPALLEKGRQAALRMVSARKESMLGALAMVDEKFGGAETYMRVQCGLGDGELEALRRNLVLVVGGRKREE